jgi:hypothetical protein
MMARLQDVLHLVAWNGYSQDIAPAVPLTRETWTDERLVFPFGIQQTYGGGKTRIQILIEHGAFDRVKELVKMALNTHHLPILKKLINSKDKKGETALTAAIKSRNVPIVKLLVKCGADINQVNKKGRSALNLAITCKEAKEPGSIKGWDLTNSHECLKSTHIVSYLTKFGAVDIPEEVMRNDWRLGAIDIPEGVMRNNWRLGEINELCIFMRGRGLRGKKIVSLNEWFYERQNLRRHVLTTVLPDAPEYPKPKKLKASLYKQQFGRR